MPPFSATNGFSILVGDFVELTLGGTVLQAGQSGSVPVTAFSSAAVTNLSFLLEAPEERLTNSALQFVAPGISGSLLTNGANQSLVTFEAASGQPILGTLPLGSLTFAATSNQPSAFVALNISSLAATQGNGVPVPGTIANNGRVVVVGAAPLLEAFLHTNRQGGLVLYGNPGVTYFLESTTNLSDAASWGLEWQGRLNDLFQVFDLNNTNQTIFYRARESRGNL